MALEVLYDNAPPIFQTILVLGQFTDLTDKLHIETPKPNTYIAIRRIADLIQRNNMPTTDKRPVYNITSMQDKKPIYNNYR